MSEVTDRVDVAKVFSDNSRNAGRVTFKVTYTATDGNLAIDKRFQEFCNIHSNNEYLQGINLLLNTFEHYNEVLVLSDLINGLIERIDILEQKLNKLENPVKDEKVKGVF